MVIVVPWKVNDLSRLQNRLQNYKFDKNDFTSEEIELNLPKFKIESSIKLKPLLKKVKCIIIDIIFIIRTIFTNNYIILTLFVCW